MKAFYLALTVLVLTAPARADDLFASPRGLQIDEDGSRGIVADWVLERSGRDRGAAAAQASINAYEAQFGARLRELVAQATEAARSAAAAGGPTEYHLSVRCVARRLVMQRAPQPALMQPALDAPPVVASKTVKACSIKMTASLGAAPEPGKLRPFSVTLSPLEEPAP